MNEINAWHAPWFDSNPYQELLSKGLSQSSVRVHKLPQSVWIASKLRNARRGDVLHLHWIDRLHMRHGRIDTLVKTAVFIVQLWWLKRRGIKLFYTLHNLDPHDSSIKSVERWTQNWVARNSNKVFVHCGFARREIIRRASLAPKRVTLVPHGNYVGVYGDESTQLISRNKINLPQDAFVILFLGALRWYKGLDELVDAFHKLQATDARLLVAGSILDDRVADELYRASMVDSRILVRAGFVDDNLIADYLSAANVMALPFKKVLTSGSLILAMSYGLPVVTCQAGCLTETGKASGIIFFGGSTGRNLTDALAIAYHERQHLPVAGARAKARARRWDWSRIGRRVARAYQS